MKDPAQIGAKYHYDWDVDLEIVSWITPPNYHARASLRALGLEVSENWLANCKIIKTSHPEDLGEMVGAGWHDSSYWLPS